MSTVTLQESIGRFLESTKDQHIKIKGQQSYLKVVDRLNFVRQTFGKESVLKLLLAILMDWQSFILRFI